MRIRWSVAVIIIAVLVACSSPVPSPTSSGKEDEDKSALRIPGAPQSPTCKGIGVSTEMPPNFPQNIKLPSGATVTGTESFGFDQPLAGYYVRGYVSLAALDLLTYWRTEVMQAGYRINGGGGSGGGGGENIMHEYLRFIGNSRYGSVQIQEVKGCQNLSLFQISITDPIN